MIITLVKPLRKSLYQLYIDGEEAVQIDKEEFILSPYKEGGTITDEQLLELINKSQTKRCKSKALYLLERKNYFKKELENKLCREYDKEIAKSCCEHFEELGLLNDYNHASLYINDMQNLKRYGKVRIKTELYRKGVSKEIIDELLYEVEDDTDNIKHILDRKYPMWSEDEKVKRRAIAALQRKGYNWSAINKVIKEEYYD